MSEIVAVGRSADSIATEIRVIVRQAHRVVCSAAIEIGERLIEAKKLVPHGEWEEYVSVRCGFKPRTAQAYMQVAAEREKAQTFADLEFSKVLLLLAMPEGQAEALTAEHDPQSMTVRDLKRQIAEYKDCLEKAAAAGAAQQQQLRRATEENGALKQRLGGIDADYKARLNAVDLEVDQLRTELKAAKTRPAAISSEDAEKLRGEGWDEGHRAGLGEKAALEGQVEQLKKQLEDQSEAMGAAHREALAGKDEEIAELRRQLAATAESSAQGLPSMELAIHEIKTVVAELQTAANKLHGCYIKHRETNPKLAASVQNMVEKMICNLYSNFGIDPI